MQGRGVGMLRLDHGEGRLEVSCLVEVLVWVKVLVLVGAVGSESGQDSNG